MALDVRCIGHEQNNNDLPDNNDFPEEQTMIPTKQSRTVVKTLLSTALIMGTFGTQAFADEHVTLVEMGDLHGTLVPHAAVLKHGKRLANYIYPVPVVIVMMTSPFIDISRADYDSELIQKSGQPPGLV
jgi:hypothetical protein